MNDSPGKHIKIILNRFPFITITFARKYTLKEISLRYAERNVFLKSKFFKTEITKIALNIQIIENWTIR